MRETENRLSLRRRYSERHLTGWRYAAVVIAGSIVLLVALVVIGIQVAAKMGINVATTQPQIPTRVASSTPKTSEANAVPSVQQDVPVVVDSASTPVSPAPEQTEAPAATASVCDTINATYKGIVTDLAKTKPDVPIVSGITGAISGLLRGQYNDRAAKYNATLDSYQSDYLQKITANACGLVQSPFSILSKANIL